MRNKPLLLTKLREEKGAAAVIVAIVLLLMFASAVLAIDAGGLWSDRRDLIIATDAAALAAASYFAVNHEQACTDEGYTAAQAEALDLLTSNTPKATLTGFEVDPSNCDSGAGVVRVEATTPGSLFFAPVIGVNQADVYSKSVAEFGPAIALSGLLPFGFCNLNEHVNEFVTETEPPPGTDGVTEHPVYTSTDGPIGTVHRIYFTKLQEGECGESPGTWGWFDYNSNVAPNGFNALRQWLENEGYPGTIWLDPHDCNDNGSPVEGENCNPQPGAGGGSVESALDSLVCAGPTQSCENFWIIMYDDAFCTGGGATCEFDQLAFLGVIIRGHNKITGQMKGSANCTPEELALLTDVDADKCPYFDIEFVERPAYDGHIGPLEDTEFIGAYLSKLCGVDHDIERCSV